MEPGGGPELELADRQVAACERVAARVGPSLTSSLKMASLTFGGLRVRRIITTSAPYPHVQKERSSWYLPVVPVVRLAYYGPVS